ncbi:MAG: trimeric intracellular cation channel family protein, partial [Gluconacetobacter sp.]
GEARRPVLRAVGRMPRVPNISPPPGGAGGGGRVASRRLAVPVAWGAVAGGLVCFGLRLMALRYGWNLPGVAR